MSLLRMIGLLLGLTAVGNSLSMISGDIYDYVLESQQEPLELDMKYDSAYTLYSQMYGYEPELPQVQREKSISVSEVYNMPVPGEWTVGPGEANIVWQFNYSGDSFLTGDVTSRDPDYTSFGKDLEKTAQYLYNYSADYYGEFLEFIGVDQIPNDEGAEAYVIYMGLNDGKQRIEITTALRFTDYYCAQFIGFNLGDMPEMFSNVQAAALAFEDLIPSGYTMEEAEEAQMKGLRYVGDFRAEPWELPVQNVFSVTKEYVKWYYPEKPDTDRKETDYVIRWNNPDMEEVARLATGIKSRPLRSSDLDGITHLDIRNGWSRGEPYRVSSGYYGGELSWMLDLSDISDLQHFQNLESLLLFMDNVKDITVFEELPKVKRLFLALSEDLEDITPVSQMTELESLMLWSGSYENIKSVECLSSLKKLQEITISCSNVNDFDVLCKLPELSEVLIISHPDIDTSKLEECSSIQKLIINAVDYRE